MLAGLAEDTGTPLKKLVDIAHEFAKFFKHADHDPTAVLETFTEKDADMVLYVACNDFSRVAKGMPVELQVYASWWLAQISESVSDASLNVHPLVRKSIELFPGVRAATRPDQLRIGWEVLENVKHNPALKMQIQREVILPAVGG